MTRPLAGMRVVIAGASAGIGAALARHLAATGARLCLGARRADRLAALVAELGPQAMGAPCDVARAADCARLIARAQAAWGGIDTLACVAGYGLARPVAETGEEDWLAILRTNLLGTAACVRAAVPLMRAQEPIAGWRGQILIVSSVLARRATPDGGAYAASKAAQLSLAEALRVELRPQRIAVTSVHPVRTATEFAVAAHAAGGRPWPGGDGEPRQSAAHVAACMARAMARPRPEVWPHRLARWAVLAAAAWPSLADRLIARRRRPTP